MTVQSEKIFTTAAIQANTAGRVDVVVNEKVFLTTAVKNDTANSTRVDAVYNEKFYGTTTVRNDTAFLNRVDAVYSEKFYLTVVIAAPTSSNASSTAIGTALGVGLGLSPGVATSNGVGSAAADAETRFTMLPVADADPGHWKNQVNGTPLYPSLRKYYDDDATYISGEPDANNDVARLKLDMSPLSSHTSPFVRYRIAKYPNLSGTPVDLVVTLQQNVTTVASWTHSNITTSTVTIVQNLTTPQAESITDYDDLYLVFTSKAFPPTA